MKVFDNLQEHILDNGLRILLLPEKEHPLATFQVWYRVGSRFEDESTRGLSHFIEHLFFKGSETMEAGEIDRRLNEIGAFNNAATSKDYTFYYAVGPGSVLEDMYSIQTDMLLRPLFDPGETDKEREVVLAEIDRSIDSPQNQFYYACMQETYGEHPYKHPVLGYKNIIETVSVSTIRDYYNSHYHPENMTVVVVGNFQAQKMREKIERDYGSIKSPSNFKSIGTRPVTSLPSKRVFSAQTQRSYSAMTFLGPDRDNVYDIMALDLLATILTDGRSSRWIKSLKEERELVEGLSFGLYTSIEKSPIFIHSVVKEEVWADYHSALEEELSRLRNFYVSREELHRAKKIEKIECRYRWQKMTDRAQSLGFYASMNQLEFCRKYEQMVDSVRLEDIIRVIEKYMSEEPNRIQMLPEGSSEPMNIAPSTKSSNFEYEIEELKPSLHHIKFSSGLQAYYQQNDLESTASCYVYVKNFSELASRFPAGTGNLLQRLISRGSVSLSQEQITHILDGIGARYGTLCSDSRTRRENYCNFLQCPSESFEQAMEVFGKFFSEAIFPQIEWDKCLSLIRMEIRAKRDSLSSYCMDHLLGNYFGEHPYASAFTGDLESIEQIKRKDVEELYAILYTPGNIVLSLSGPCAVEEILPTIYRHLESKLGTLELEIAESKVPLTFQSSVLGEIISVENPKEQAYLMPCYSVPGQRHEDYFVGLLVNEILGGGMSSRYFRNMRDEKSYGYEIGSRYLAYMNYGILFSFLGTEPGRVESAIEDFRKEIIDIQQDGAELSELEKAKKLVISKYAFAQETLFDRTALLGNTLSKGLSLEYLEQYESNIQAVKLEDLGKFARNYLKDPFIQVVSPLSN